MKIFGKEGLRDLDFNIPKGKVTARQALMLNLVEEEMPSAFDVDKADYRVGRDCEKHGGFNFTFE